MENKVIDNRSKYFVLFIGIVLFIIACPEKQNHPEPGDTTIHLDVVHEGTFAVKLNVSVDDSSDNWTFELTRDDSVVNTVTSNQADTTITDGNLNPGQTYTYKAYWLNNNTRADSSTEVIATTMDTTSHNFTWEIDTLGEYGSYLNDVWIVDENNIWVVGNIETDSGEYNAARWDGNEWEMMEIQPQGYVQPLKSIYYFSDDNIWFGQSTLPIHWDGSTYYIYTPANDNYPGGSIINAIWASSPDDIYFVGSGGGIVHYYGSGFEKMETGTDVDLKDIEGTSDGERVFASGWDNHPPGGYITLQLINSAWSTLFYNEDSHEIEGNVGRVYSVGVDNDTLYLSTYEGLWKYNYITHDSVMISGSISHLNESGFIATDAKNSNNIFFGGAGFKYVHYNGSTYYYNHELSDMFYQRAMLGADYNGNLAVMVGYFDFREHALTARGYRQ